MALGSVTSGGRFTSDGLTKIINLPSGVDWMEVRNLTNAGATGDDGVYFMWQRGMADFTGIYNFKSGGGNNLNQDVLAAPSGFHAFNSSESIIGPRTAITSISGALPPVVLVASTANLKTGDVVRIEDVTGGQQLGGLDFTIEVTSGTTFELANMDSIGAATAGWFRTVTFPHYMYPPYRYISDISQAQQAIVETTVDHDYKVGSRLRMAVPATFGMTQMDGLMVSVVAVTANTFTIDVDSSAFTTFAFPTSAVANTNYQPAMVFPVGVDLEVAHELAVSDVDSAFRNIAIRGMMLPGGASAPGGASGDVMYWQAGTFLSINNE